jgi:hypothetical protein
VAFEAEKIAAKARLQINRLAHIEDLLATIAMNIDPRSLRNGRQLFSKLMQSLVHTKILLVQRCKALPFCARVA